MNATVDQEARAVIDHDAVMQALGPFDEFDFLGRGTFGQTYRVKRKSDEYAVKVIHLSGLAPYMLDREVEALRRINHPNVMAFREYSVVSIAGEDRPVLECEYVKGPSVEEALRQGALLNDEAEAHGFLAGLLLAAREMATNGVIHRDIKPSNISLRGGDWSAPVVLDFGLAKVVDMTSHTATPAWRGTWPFMAPEQLRGRRATYRSDLFAIATVVYLAGTGEHPYYRTVMRDPQELLHAIQGAQPPDPRLASDVFAGRDAEVIIRLLSAESHQRLSVERALADLEVAS
jgi:eukaryotic-like serine/threonine-protein kinase